MTGRSTGAPRDARPWSLPCRLFRVSCSVLHLTRPEKGLVASFILLSRIEGIHILALEFVWAGVI